MITGKWGPIIFSSHNQFLAVAEDAGNMKAKAPVLYVLAYDPMSCHCDEQSAFTSLLPGTGNNEALRHLDEGNLCPENC